MKTDSSKHRIKSHTSSSRFLIIDWSGRPFTLQSFHNEKVWVEFGLVNW